MGKEINKATRNRLSGERIAEMLDIATEVFLEKGYTAASTSAIAAQANASKSTFYKRFPSKQDLFHAVVERHTEKSFEGMVQLSLTASVHDALLAFGKDVLRVLLNPDQIRLVRLISAEVERHPELAHHYFRCGPHRAELLLQQYFKQQIEAKRVDNDRAETMASHFMSLITGSPVRWYVLGFDPTPLTPSKMEKHLQACVKLLLRRV